MADIGPLVRIDPEVRVVGVAAFEGSLKVIPVDQSGKISPAPFSTT